MLQHVGTERTASLAKYAAAWKMCRCVCIHRVPSSSIADMDFYIPEK